MKIHMLTPEQAERCIAICWAAKVPINLVGAPGVGKTTAVDSFAARLQAKDKDMGYWTSILSMKGPEDFGLPAPDGGTLKYLFPPDLPIGNPNAKGVLFLDEWDRCNDMATRNAAMQLTLGGHFHGTKLSPGVFTILAMNGTSDIDTVELSEAARTRMVHIYIGTQAPGYWDSWTRWAAKANVNPVVAGFSRFRSDLFKKGEQFEELARYNPRTSGHLLNKLRAAIEAATFLTADIRQALYAGAVGDDVALQFLAYETMWQEVPDLDEVLAHPTTTKVPTSNGVFFAVAMAIANRLKDAKNGAVKAASTYVARWPMEAQVYGYTVLGEVVPAIMATPEYIAMKNKLENS